MLAPPSKPSSYVAKEAAGFAGEAQDGMDSSRLESDSFATAGERKLESAQEVLTRSGGCAPAPTHLRSAKGRVELKQAA